MANVVQRISSFDSLEIDGLPKEMLGQTYFIVAQMEDEENQTGSNYKLSFETLYTAIDWYLGYNATQNNCTTSTCIHDIIGNEFNSILDTYVSKAELATAVNEAMTQFSNSLTTAANQLVKINADLYGGYVSGEWQDATFATTEENLDIFRKINDSYDKTETNTKIENAKTELENNITEKYNDLNAQINGVQNMETLKFEGGIRQDIDGVSERVSVLEDYHANGVQLTNEGKACEVLCGDGLYHDIHDINLITSRKLLLSDNGSTNNAPYYDSAILDVKPATITVQNWKHITNELGVEDTTLEDESVEIDRKVKVLTLTFNNFGTLPESYIIKFDATVGDFADALYDTKIRRIKYTTDHNVFEHTFKQADNKKTISLAFDNDARRFDDNGITHELIRSKSYLDGNKRQDTIYEKTIVKDNDFKVVVEIELEGGWCGEDGNDGTINPDINASATLKVFGLGSYEEPVIVTDSTELQTSTQSEETVSDEEEEIVTEETNTLNLPPMF